MYKEYYLFMFNWWNLCFIDFNVCFAENLPDFKTFSMPENEMQLNKFFKTMKAVEEYDMEKIKKYDPEMQIPNIPTDLIKNLPKLKE